MSVILCSGDCICIRKIKIPKRLFDPQNPMTSASYIFNSACEGPQCLPATEIDLGSVAIDYESDPTNSIFHRMVCTEDEGGP